MAARYRLEKDKMKAIASRKILISSLIRIISIITGTAIAVHTIEITPTTLLILFAFIFLFVSFMHLKQSRKILKQLTTFQITIDDDGIRREIERQSPLYIQFSDLRGAIETPDAMILTGKTKRDVMVIPVAIESFEKIRATIADHISIESRSNPYRGYVILILSVGITLGLFAVAVLSRNKYISPVAAILLVLILVWSMFQSIRLQRKKILILVTLLPVISLLIIAYYHIAMW